MLTRLLAKRKKGKKKEKFTIVGSTDIIPKADWWALTYTQAKKGIEIDALYRPEKKSKYKTLLQKYGAGLTFPTRFIEKKKIRSPLDVTILRNKKKKVRLV
jgi:ABC-type phosphate transport system substrate-binding protein